MKSLRIILTTVMALLVTSVLATDVHAQATRTWVSGVGDDANPCSRTAPCKTFAGAISKTAAGGEISALDPGGFGAVTITKSITINGDGTLAGILAAGTSGIIINALGTDKIIIRGISINGANTGLNGIRILNAGQVTIENTTIYGFQANVSSRCIDVVVPSGGELVVINSTMTNCANGIRLQNTANLFLATIDRSAITNMNSIGIEAAVGDVRVNIKGSNISSNGTDGLKASSSLGLFNVEDSLVGFNVGIAINASVSGARFRISGNTIVNNSTGVTIAGGATVQSAANNRIDGNGATTAPNGVYVQQ